MDAITRDQLPYLILLILPGFLTRKVFDMLVPGDRLGASQQVIEALTYGLLNLGVWFVPLTEFILPRRDSDPWLFRGSAVAMLVVTPLVWAIVMNALLRSRLLGKWLRHPVPTAWDFFYGQQRPGFVLIRLKSGSMIGGRFDGDSFAGSYPHRDLYLQEAWKLDDQGRFERPVSQSLGILLSMQDCELLEFFAVSGPEGSTDATTDNQASDSARDESDPAV